MIQTKTRKASHLYSITLAQNRHHHSLVAPFSLFDIFVVIHFAIVFYVSSCSCVISLFLFAISIVCCNLVYFICSISCFAVVSLGILYYRSHFAVVSFVVLALKVILPRLYPLCPACRTIPKLSQHWACLAYAQAGLQYNSHKASPNWLTH